MQQLSERKLSSEICLRRSNNCLFVFSLDRGDKFQFSLGKAEVIKGWDLGVATMCRGERAVFTIRADYAYGKSGKQPQIPPNATLLFEVELCK